MYNVACIHMCHFYIVRPLLLLLVSLLCPIMFSPHLASRLSFAICICIEQCCCCAAQCIVVLSPFCSLHIVVLYSVIYCCVDFVEKPKARSASSSSLSKWPKWCRHQHRPCCPCHRSCHHQHQQLIQPCPRVPLCCSHQQYVMCAFLCIRHAVFICAIFVKKI